MKAAAATAVAVQAVQESATATTITPPVTDSKTPFAMRHLT